ncbi:putative 3-beta hydroxysteroid dehydrogenase/isomerase [Eremomyces bilateralis CBS 781.70]|uniref:3-beta hydroxysteroid dehydrogenase/isomerase n=1 Tax=Eremomyces bilateralis CBS 781.70 TaxID=1392243 RepID=A0A6G1G0T9_9PEZI|nr:putative 3-beta hydroxysteroid dehydrogenase/isomerase [Eremomyces bilateralis CBS 781.70]KAF1811540.1 putative 3-beta hydroxysteroid dehydrogenase/isomerase [Eremomyces bilateralis CBS 781.70]
MQEIVLITGATGFIGFKTLLLALEAGHTVRAVIRKPEQAQKLKTHVKIVPHTDRLEFAVVPDLTKDGALDHVLVDVMAILHIASPLDRAADDYERNIISPAVGMITSLLNSAIKVPTIKRLIITSSMTTLIPFEWFAKPEGRIYTAKDRNLNPRRSVSLPMEAYWTSKALARNAVHDFVETRKPHFETIQMLPGVVMGSDDRASSTADLRNHTNQWALRLSPILGEKRTDSMVGVPVDLTDVARAQVEAINPSIPGNVDYTLCAESPEGIVWDSMNEVAKKYFPDRVGSEEMPLGGTLPTMTWRVDARETEQVFGWKFSTFEEMMKGVFEQYLELVDAER